MHMPNSADFNHPSMHQNVDTGVTPGEKFRREKRAAGMRPVTAFFNADEIQQIDMMKAQLRLTSREAVFRELLRNETQRHRQCDRGEA